MWRQVYTGLVLSLALTAQADQKNEWQFEVGGGGTIFQAPWKGVDIEATPLPYFSARYGRWGFGVGEGLVQYSLLQSDLHIALGLGYRDETYQSDFALLDYDSDDTVFRDYDSPKGEATARLDVDYSYFHLRIAQDIQGRSDGVTALLQADIPLYRHSSGWQVMAKAGAYWMQDKYATHVFGVEADNVNEQYGRFEYKAEDSINYFGGLQVYVPVYQRHSLRGFLRYESLDSEITNSPLVGRDYRAHFGIMYVVSL